MQEVRKLDRAAYQVDPAVLTRYDASRDAFGQRPWNSSWLAFNCHAIAAGADDVGEASRHCQVQEALYKVANAIELHFIRHFCGLVPDRSDPAVGEAKVANWTGDDPAANASHMKAAARKIGADLVGICV